MRPIFDSLVRMPDQPAPLPRRVTTRERLGSNLIDAVSARRLTLDARPGALDGVSVVDSFASVADSEHGWSAR
jgi:hypothetical protein